MLKTCSWLMNSVCRDRRAVTAMEYGLIAALVAVVIIGTLTTLGTNLTTQFAAISAGIAAH